MAEGDGLLNRCTVNTVPWVRIPSPPPAAFADFAYHVPLFVPAQWLQIIAREFVRTMVAGVIHQFLYITNDNHRALNANICIFF